MRSVAIVGAGAFGAATAAHLAARGDRVTLIDPGPIPHPLAESTDISKAVRADYGSDEAYAAAMDDALAGWHRWNAEHGSPLFHRTGMLFLTRAGMGADSFEHASFETLSRRGHELERFDEPALRRRFPAWSGHAEGYLNPRAGFAESGNVVSWLVSRAHDAGAAIIGNARVTALDPRAKSAPQIVLANGDTIDADVVIVAAGAWSRDLVPALVPLLRPTAHPVFHLAPSDPALFEAARFPTFGADIAKTGWYGFPLHAGVVKIANHGAGRSIHPSSDRSVTDEERSALRAFVAAHLPALADAPIVSERTCVYGDTIDEHFLIDRVPDVPNLIVAAGGSGHGFKFAPLVGPWVSAILDGHQAPMNGRFAWRPATSEGREQARARQ
jgi:glycine/D-amino acid oxidase-like deaminating enzyme